MSEERYKYVYPSKIPEALKCFICFKIYYKPMRLDCGHVFCKICINKWLKK